MVGGGGVGGWVGGKIIPRIRLTSAKDLVEVEAELGNITFKQTRICNRAIIPFNRRIFNFEILPTISKMS